MRHTRSAILAAAITLAAFAASYASAQDAASPQMTDADFLKSIVQPKVLNAKTQNQIGLAAVALIDLLPNPQVAASPTLRYRVKSEAISLAMRSADPAIPQKVIQAIVQSSLTGAQRLAEARDYAGALNELTQTQALLKTTRPSDDLTRWMNQRMALYSLQTGAYNNIKPLLEKHAANPLDEKTVDRLLVTLTRELMDFKTAAALVSQERLPKLHQYIQLALTPSEKLTADQARELAEWYYDLGLESTPCVQFEFFSKAGPLYVYACKNYPPNSKDAAAVGFYLAGLNKRLDALQRDDAPALNFEAPAPPPAAVVVVPAAPAPEPVAKRPPAAPPAPASTPVAESDTTPDDDARTSPYFSTGLTNTRTFVLKGPPGAYSASFLNNKTIQVQVGPRSIWGFATGWGIYNHSLLSGTITTTKPPLGSPKTGNLAILVEFDGPENPPQRLYLYFSQTNTAAHVPDGWRALNEPPIKYLKLSETGQFKVNLRDYAPKNWNSRSRVAFLVQSVSTDAQFTLKLR